MNMLHKIFSLTSLGDDEFRADFVRPRDGSLDGGQVAAQAVYAGSQTVPIEFNIHSAHVSFIASGDSMKPVEFRVFRDRDGKSFATRHVQVFQENRLIVRVTASYTRVEPGLDVQQALIPQVKKPEDSPQFDPSVLGFLTRNAMADTSQVPDAPTIAWVKTQVAIGDDARLHACALLYFSDMVNAMPDLVSDTSAHFQTSLDHTVWFHRAVNTDDWVLMSLEGMSLASGRAWFQGKFFDQSGVLIASSAQELLFRPIRK